MHLYWSKVLTESFLILHRTQSQKDRFKLSFWFRFTSLFKAKNGIGDKNHTTVTDFVENI